MKNFISLIFISLFLFAGCEEKLATLEAKNKLITGPSFDLALTTMPASFDDDATPDFIFAATNNIPNVDHYECSLNSAAFSVCTSPITLPTLAEGSHTFSVKAFDSAGKFEQVDHSWVVSLMDLTDLSYFSQEVSVLFSHDFNPTGGSGNYSFSLPTNPNGASINAAGIFSVTEATFGLYSYVVRVTDTTTSLTFDYNFNLEVTQSPICVWTGAVDTDWANAGNWRTCSGAAPIATSKVIVGPGVNQPLIAVTTTIDSFGEGSGGGTVIIGPGVDLNLTNTTETFSSSVMIQGASPACTTCRVVPVFEASIVKGATLTLGTGIQFRTSPTNYRAKIFVGDATTAGHFKTVTASSNIDEWPFVETNNRFDGFFVEGSAGNLSSIDINGLRINRSRSHASYRTFNFINYYSILNLDKIKITTYDTTLLSSYFKLENCGNASFSDTTWSDLMLNTPPANESVKLIDANLCSGIAPITLAGTGPGFKVDSEIDPNNIINWITPISNTCIWNGSIDTDFTNPDNWSSCTNGIDNYPGAQDWIVVPSTANQPVVTGIHYIQGVGIGAGGGVISINTSAQLFLLENTKTIQSDIQFQGINASCTNCYVFPVLEIAIVNDATLTLGNGLKVYMSYSNGNAKLLVGDGVTSGHLKTVADTGNSNEWPILHGWNRINGIIVEGTITHNSSVDIDGLDVDRAWSHSSVKIFDFVNYYEVKKFDKIAMDTYNITVAANYIRLANCGNGIFTDSTWDEVNFKYPMVNASTVSVDASNCSGIAPITISGSGPAFGSEYELDPNNIITWANEASSTCEWNGSVDNDFKNPANWNSCVNGRNNYPDHLDWVVIPGSATYPVINEMTFIKGFGLGVGGGEITVASNWLWFMDKTQTIRSDIKIKGSTTTCTNCLIVPLGNMYIVDDSALTLGNGIELNMGIADGANAGKIFVGDGVTAGHFKTVADTGNSAEWPEIYSYNRYNGMTIEGVLTSPSSVEIDGLTAVRGQGGGGTLYPMFNFVDYYEFVTFDNIFMDVYGTTNTNNSIRLSNCTNGIFTDNDWSSLHFNTAMHSAPYFSVDASACSGIGAISISSATGPAAGAAYEDDPNNIINWP